MSDECPRCPAKTLTQYSYTNNCFKCMKCNVAWRGHNVIYCMKCDHAHMSGFTTINSIKDGLSGWIVCDNCEVLIHEEVGTAKHIRVVEYL